MENLEQEIANDEILNQEPPVDNEPAPEPEPDVILKDIVLDGSGGFDCQYLHKDIGWIAFTCPAEPNGKDGKRAMWAYNEGRYEGEPVDKQPQPAPSEEEIRILRSRAYSDPINGSDKHFAESLRKRAMDDIEGAELAEAKGLSRVEEIKSKYPMV